MLADPRGIGTSPPIPSRSVDFGMHDHIDYDWPAFLAKAKDEDLSSKALKIKKEIAKAQASA